MSAFPDAFCAKLQGHKSTLCEMCSLPAWKQPAFNLAMIHWLALRGNAPLWPQGTAKKHPHAFRVLSSGKAGGKRDWRAFLNGNPKNIAFASSYSKFILFFKANSNFSAASPGSAFPVRVPAAVK